jgi:O-antigen ligase
MQYTLYSVFLVLTTGIALNRMLTSESIKFKIIYGILFITTTVNLFINPGRTGQFIFIFILASVLIGHYKATLKSLLFTLSLLFIIPYLAFTYNPIFKLRMTHAYNNSVNNHSSETSVGVRIALNIIAKDIFLENPIIGVGVGDYLIKKNEILSQKYPNKIRAKELVHYHNQYSEFAVIAGLFGLLSYIFILISLIKTKITDQRIYTTKYILVITIALSSFTDAIFHLNQPLSLFALFAGLIVAQSRYERKEIKT